jgi:hypothetical protein
MHTRLELEVAMRQKSITLRLPEDEYKTFTAICHEKGYSKTGKIREFIRNMVATEMSEAKSSAGEWEKVREGMRSEKSRSNREKARKPYQGPVLSEPQEDQRPEEDTSTEIWKL